jgi:hypothetical protein
MAVAGAFLIGRFAYLFIVDPGRSGHTQSLIIGVGCVIVGSLGSAFVALAELFALNRRLLRELLDRLETLDPASGERDPRKRSSRPPDHAPVRKNLE